MASLYRYDKIRGYGFHVEKVEDVKPSFSRLDGEIWDVTLIKFFGHLWTFYSLRNAGDFSE